MSEGMGLRGPAARMRKDHWRNGAAALMMMLGPLLWGCAASNQQSRQATLQAEDARRKAAQAEQAADKARVAAEQAQIAADRAQKAVEDATREINRVADHIDRINHEREAAGD